jgi:hypothetical protein
MGLDLIDFTQMTVSNPKMLQKGGGVAMGRYTRTRRNVVVSPKLKARNEWAAQNMRANCSLGNVCLPEGMNRSAVGQPVPGNAGKSYVDCTDEERVSRIEAARTCAISTLSTKGGIYGKA